MQSFCAEVGNLQKLFCCVWFLLFCSRCSLQISLSKVWNSSFFGFQRFRNDWSLQRTHLWKRKKTLHQRWLQRYLMLSWKHPKKPPFYLGTFYPFFDQANLAKIEIYHELELNCIAANGTTIISTYLSNKKKLRLTISIPSLPDAASSAAFLRCSRAFRRCCSALRLSPDCDVRMSSEMGENVPH